MTIVNNDDQVTILSEQAHDKDIDRLHKRARTDDLALRDSVDDDKEHNQGDDSDSMFSDTEDVLDLIAHMEKEAQDEEVSSMKVTGAEEIKTTSESPVPSSDTASAKRETPAKTCKPSLLDVNTEDLGLQLRKDLKKFGIEGFLDKYLVDQELSCRNILESFGLRLPRDFDEADDLDLLPILRIYLAREFNRRERLPHVTTIEDVARLLKSSRNIIVITGAGISTSLGIPDFRSEGGIYSRLAQYNLTDPQELFDIHLFREDSSIFYSFAKDLLPEDRGYSPTHAFIRLLQDQGRLLRMYTQNIDNIESSAGIHEDKLVQCHGSFKTATCLTCLDQVPGESIFPEIKRGQIPRCATCLLKTTSSSSHSKKRKQYDSDTSEENDDEATDYALMKPDITFFGEQLSTRFKTQILSDKERVDLVLCIGTSLKVAPVADVPNLIAKHVPQIFISREPAGKDYVFDVELLGACDDVVSDLVRRTDCQNAFKVLVERGKLSK